MEFRHQQIQRSFEPMRPKVIELVDFFYQVLFSDSPQTIPIFEPFTTPLYKRALALQVVKIVDNLSQIDNLTKSLTNFGKRHRSYGISKEHYNVVRFAALKAVNHFLDKNWSEQIQDQWGIAYDLVSVIIFESAEISEKKVLTNDNTFYRKGAQNKLNAIFHKKELQALKKAIEQRFKVSSNKKAG